MSETKKIRLHKVAKELNVATQTLIKKLQEKGFDIAASPMAKLSEDMYEVLLKTYQSEKIAKEEADQIQLGKEQQKETIDIEEDARSQKKKREEGDEILIKNVSTSDIKKKEKKKGGDEVVKPQKEKLAGPKVVGKVDLEQSKKEKKQEEDPEAKSEKGKDTSETAKTDTSKDKKRKKDKKAKPEEKHETEYTKIDGPKVVGKIDLAQKEAEEARRKKLVASSSDDFIPKKRKKRKKKRIKKKDKKEEAAQKTQQPQKGKKKKDVSEKEVEEQVKATLSKMDSKSKKARAKYKRAKRKEVAAREEAVDTDQKVLKVTEFIPANELANLLDIQVNELITACMNLGLVVSINQRLDAEVIELIAGEYDYEVEFVDIREEDELLEEETEAEEDDPKDLQSRAPIVTVMGHVDHGKTKLLDHIRKENVIAGEAGGITQHIGAYRVNVGDGKMITFLDTPGHEAFTAMRARGAKLTDVAVIVIAADEGIKPQTKEAISHAQAAGVGMIFALNKMDKPDANPEKVKEELSKMNILVEDWGGKYQSQEISALKGTHVDEILEKILLEAELLELQANPNREAAGTVIEAWLDKGKGYLSTLLVQNGSLKKGDMIVAGPYYGRVKAMVDERLKEVKSAGPATPVQILGLNGAPQAGDKFKIYHNEQEAKEVAKKREQIIREQGLRAQKHITLDEIGRRLALGTFKELNLIVKGDVDGSVEALSDALLKLSTEEIQTNIIHKGVGQITESDVLLASASDAIIIGFQVRPSASARKLAEKEDIEVRLYSIIYDVIEEVKSAMEGMLEPQVEEEITAQLEIREVFKISKVGTIAGCHVTDGKIRRKDKVRVVRDGVVVYTGELASLKRFKDDVKEVQAGMECGLNVENFNDIKVGDEIEGFREVEVARKL